MNIVQRFLRWWNAPPDDRRARGQEFARCCLAQGFGVQLLLGIVNNSREYDDFDRGIEDVLAEHEAHKTSDEVTS